MAPQTPSRRLKELLAESSTKKKERKAVKKAARASARPKHLTAAEIEHISRIIHLPVSAGEEGDENVVIEDPLGTPDVKHNLSYHARTFNYRVPRSTVMNTYQAPDKHDEKEMRDDLARILTDLEIPPYSSTLSKRLQGLVFDVCDRIRDDLELVRKENEGTMMRKAGYWRYANKNTYNNMVATNSIVDWKTGEKLAVVSEDNQPAAEAAHAVEQQAANEPEPDRITEAEDESASEASDRKISTSTSSGDASLTSFDDLQKPSELSNSATVTSRKNIDKASVGTPLELGLDSGHGVPPESPLAMKERKAQRNRDKKAKLQAKAREEVKVREEAKALVETRVQQAAKAQAKASTDKSQLEGTSVKADYTVIYPDSLATGWTTLKGATKSKQHCDCADHKHRGYVVDKDELAGLETLVNFYLTSISKAKSSGMFLPEDYAGQLAGALGDVMTADPRDTLDAGIEASGVTPNTDASPVIKALQAKIEKANMELKQAGAVLAKTQGELKLKTLELHDTEMELAKVRGALALKG